MSHCVIIACVCVCRGGNGCSVHCTPVSCVVESLTTTCTSRFSYLSFILSNLVDFYLTEMVFYLVLFIDLDLLTFEEICRVFCYLTLHRNYNMLLNYSSTEDVNCSFILRSKICICLEHWKM